MPDQSTLVTVKSPDGDLGTVDSAHLNTALSRGFQIPSNDEITSFNNHITYGEGVGNMAKAFGAGAARSATFGLSDQAMTKTGLVEPETLEQLKKQNPGSSLAGEVTGIAGSLLLAPELSPVGLMSKAGAAVTKAALPGAETAARLIANPETSAVASRIVSQTGAHALGSAVEGAAYGLGQSVSEQALGDPSLNGEKVLTNVGLGALLGGALGGALKAGEIAVPEILGSAKEALSTVYRPAKQLAEDAGIKASSFISGKPESTIRDVWENRSLALHSPEQQQELVKTTTNDLQKQYETLSKATRTASNDIRPEETKALLNGADSTAAKAELEKTNQLIQTRIEEMKAQPELFPKNFPAKLEQLQTALNRGLDESAGAGDIYANLNEFKQNLDPIAKFGKRAGLSEADAVNVFKGLRNDVKNGLENEAVWGEAGARQASYNDSLNEHLFYQKQFEKSFMKQAVTRSGGMTFKMDQAKVRGFFSNIKNLTGEERSEILENYLGSSNKILGEIEQSYGSLPNRDFESSQLKGLIGKNSDLAAETSKQAEFNKSVGQLVAGGHNSYLGETAAAMLAMHNPALAAAVETFTMLRNPGMAIPRLAKLERMAQKTTELLDRGVRGIFSATGSASEALKGFVGGKAADTFKGTKLQDKKVASEQNDTFAKFNDLSNNPSKLIDHLDNSTRDLYHVAPKTAQSLQTATAAAVSFLASKVPQPTQTRPLSPKYVPSQTEIATFNRYLNTVENPASVLGHVKNATLTKEHLEALSSVYPKLYAQMQTQVMDQLSDHLAKDRPPLPYRVRLALGMFLNQDLDGSTDPQAILGNQSALAGGAQAQNEQDRQIKVSQSGLSKVSVANRSLTGQQANAQRQS